mmetsp:Transcript_62894/g.169737  ORF Transcript_62894/g.169737 Transcript_62894/m.169737 type:complete len:302 (-) Transcript_62894:29-934(-)
MLDDASYGECWQQHFQMDRIGDVVGIDSLTTGEEVHHLTNHCDPRRIETKIWPRNGNRQLVHKASHEDAEDSDEDKLHDKLPLRADVDGLQRDHEKESVQVVEDGQDANLLEDPSLLHASSLEHGEEDARRSRRREPCCDERLLPRQAELAQRVHEIDSAADPRDARRRHGNQVLAPILAEAGRVDVELESDVHHDVGHTEHRDHLDDRLPRAIGAGVHPLWDQLRPDESHEEVAAEDHQPTRAQRRLAGLRGRRNRLLHCQLVLRGGGPFDGRRGDGGGHRLGARREGDSRKNGIRRNTI